VTNDPWRNIENLIEGAVEQAQHAVSGVAPPGPTEITRARSFLQATGKYTPAEISGLSDFQLVEEAADEQNRQELGIDSKVDPATVIRWRQNAQEHDDVVAIKDYLEGTGKYARDELERMTKRDLVDEVRDEAQRQLIGNASRLDPATLKLHLDAEQGYLDRKEVEDYLVDVGKLPRSTVEGLSREDIGGWVEAIANVIGDSGVLAGVGRRSDPSRGRGTGTGTTAPNDGSSASGSGSDRPAGSTQNGTTDDGLGPAGIPTEPSGSGSGSGGGGGSPTGEEVPIVFQVSTGDVEADPSSDSFTDGSVLTFNRSADGRWFDEAGHEVTDPNSIAALEQQYNAYKAEGGADTNVGTVKVDEQTYEEAVAAASDTDSTDASADENSSGDDASGDDASGGHDTSGDDASGDEEERGGVEYTPVGDATFVDLRRIDFDPGKLRGSGGDVDPADPSFDGGRPVVGEIVDWRRTLVGPPDPEVVGGTGRGTIPDSIQPDAGVIDPTDDAVGRPGEMGPEDDPFAGLRPGLEPSASDPVGDDPVLQPINPSLSVLHDLDLEPKPPDSIMDFDGLDL
jgi:hypothetical protein